MIFRISYLVTAFLFVGSISAYAQVGSGSDDDQLNAPTQVIVKVKADAERIRAQDNAVYESIQATSIRRFGEEDSLYEEIELDVTADMDSAIKELSSQSWVEYAQPNYTLKIPHIYDEDLTSPAWPPTGKAECIGGDCDKGILPVDWTWQDWLETIRFYLVGAPPTLKPAPKEVIPAVADPKLKTLYGMKKIGADLAWKTNKGSKGIIVADIDTGIDYNHEDLSFNLWRNPRPSSKGDVVGYNFVNNNGNPFDDNRHGTHTAGTIGAVGGNGRGVSGVAQRVSIMALKFLNGKGQGSTSDAIRAIDYALAHGARILSNSWGGPSELGNRALEDAINRARVKGVLFVAAAGNEKSDNDGPKPSYPAAFHTDNMITVAATDDKDQMASFSNWGKTTTHVAAPGVKIFSTLPFNKYAAFSGTSMACPHVAGAAALLWAANPSLNYKQVKELLLKTAVPVPSLQGKTITGARINLGTAMTMLKAGKF